MEKKKYVELTCKAILLTHRTPLLAGSGSSTDPGTTGLGSTPPDGIPGYGDWLE